MSIATEKIRIQLTFMVSVYEKILFGCFMYALLPCLVRKNQEWLRAAT
jgi:hypothetical protein